MAFIIGALAILGLGIAIGVYITLYWIGKKLGL